MASRPTWVRSLGLFRFPEITALFREGYHHTDVPLVQRPGTCGNTVCRGPLNEAGHVILSHNELAFGEYLSFLSIPRVALLKSFPGRGTSSYFDQRASFFTAIRPLILFFARLFTQLFLAVAI